MKYIHSPFLLDLIIQIFFIGLNPAISILIDIRRTYVKFLKEEHFNFWLAIIAIIHLNRWYRSYHPMAGNLLSGTTDLTTHSRAKSKTKNNECY